MHVFEFIEGGVGLGLGWVGRIGMGWGRGRVEG